MKANARLMVLLNKWHEEWRRYLQQSRNPELTDNHRAMYRLRAELLQSCSRRVKRAMGG